MTTLAQRVMGCTELGMFLRPYKASDLDAVFALDVACFAPRFRFSRAMMRSVTSTPGAVVLLACETAADGVERLLGFCAGDLHRSVGEAVGYVATLDVAPAHRGQGIGRTLMEALEAKLREAGAQRIALHVHVENTAALMLYERLGYVRQQRERGFYGRGFDAWLYTKPLHATAVKP